MRPVLKGWKETKVGGMKASKGLLVLLLGFPRQRVSWLA